jgi:hypothetical protein
MAPIFKHGRGSRVLFNTRDLSEIMNEAEVKVTCEAVDVTCFVTSTGGTTTDKQYISGMKDATIEFGGYTDASTAYVSDTLRQALQASTKPKATYGPGAVTVGQPAFLVFGDLTDNEMTATCKDAVMVSASMQASQLRFGYWMVSPSAPITSSGNQTGVLDRMVSTSGTAANSTLGGVAHCHVVSATTSTGQIKVQHSTDNVTYADLITFTISSGRSVTRSTVAGTVKEYVRGQVTKMQASGATVGVAFARHPRQSTSRLNP